MAWFSTSVQTPSPRDYGQETRDTLQAQVDLAPQLFAAEASEAYGQPAYTQLGLRTLRGSLEGMGGEPGMLSQYEDSIAPSLRRVDAANLSAQREADISAVERLGPRATAAMEAADPTSQRIDQELSGQVFSDLQDQGRLSGRERRSAQQGARQSYGARGLLYSPAAGQAEQYTEFMTQDAKRLRSQQQASQYLGQRKSLYGDPFMAVLGRSSGIGSQGQSFLTGGRAQVGASGPGLFQPESGYAQQMYNQQWQGQLAASTANAANKAAIGGAVIGAAGSIFGGMARGGTGFFK